MLTPLAVLSVVLFVIGFYGVLVKKNAVVVLFSLELMLNAVNLNLASFARLAGATKGYVFVLFSLAIAAAGAAVGLAALLALYRHTGTTDVTAFRLLGVTAEKGE